MMKRRFLKITASSSTEVPPPVPEGDWNKLTQRNPHIPANAAQLGALTQYLFGQVLSGNRLLGNSLGSFDECAEAPFANFRVAFQNPALSESDFKEIQDKITKGTRAVATKPGSKKPCWIIKATQHFEIEAICGINVDKAAELLESLWDFYQNWIFSKLPAGEREGRENDWALKTKILIYPLGRIRADTAPDSPIRFNSEFWGEDDGFQRALIAHELFHRVQYLFGYRTRHEPTLPYAWFSEGSAVWMEQLAAGRITSTPKFQAAYEFPQLGLLNSSYYAGPAWLSLVPVPFGVDSEDYLSFIRSLLLRYAGHGNPVLAFQQASEATPSNLGIPRVSSLDDLQRVSLLRRAVPRGQSYLGTGGTRVNLEASRKLIQVPAAILGYVRPLAGQLYRLDLPAGPQRVIVRLIANRESQIEMMQARSLLDTRDPGPSRVGPGAELRLETNGNSPIDIAVIGLRGVGASFVLHAKLEGREDLPAPALTPARLSRVQGDWRMDSFGNMLRPGIFGGNLMLGFQVDSFSSLEVEGTQRGTRFSYELDGGRPSGAGSQDRPWQVTVRPQAGFKTGIASITRKAWLEGTRLAIETSVVGSASRFYAISLAAKAGDTLIRIRDNEGPPPPCDESRRDCDGHCRPVLPPSGGIFRDGNWQQIDPQEPIIPFTGYVIQPWPVFPDRPQSWIHYYDSEEGT